MDYGGGLPPIHTPHGGEHSPPLLPPVTGGEFCSILGALGGVGGIGFWEDFKTPPRNGGSHWVRWGVGVAFSKIAPQALEKYGALGISKGETDDLLYNSGPGPNFQ